MYGQEQQLPASSYQQFNDDNNGNDLDDLMGGGFAAS